MQSQETAPARGSTPATGETAELRARCRQLTARVETLTHAVTILRRAVATLRRDNEHLQALVTPDEPPGAGPASGDLPASGDRPALRGGPVRSRVRRGFRRGI